VKKLPKPNRRAGQTLIIKVKKKSKAIPVTGLEGL
jgi:hypothetical protein